MFHNVNMALAKMEKRLAPTTQEAINFFGGKLKIGFDSIPDDIMGMSASQLEEKCTMSEMDYLLRRNLWKKVEQAIEDGAEHIQIVSVYGGVMTRQSFDKVMENPYRLAWMLLHPQEDIDRMRTMLAMGITKIERELLSQPLTERTLPSFVKLMEIFMNRVHGPTIQRIEAKHAHVNLNKPIAQNPNEVIDRLNELKNNLIKGRQFDDKETQAIEEADDRDDNRDDDTDDTKNNNERSESAIEVYATEAAD